MIHSKKAGVSFDVIEFIIKIFALIFVLIFLVMSTKSFFRMKVNANLPRFSVVENEIMSSPQLIYFNNKTGQFEYGVFDWSKFNDENLKNTFNVNLSHTLSMKLNLSLTGNNFHKEKGPIYLNKQYYEYMLAQSFNYGKESTSIDKVLLPVLVYYHGKFYNGLLKGDIIINYGG